LESESNIEEIFKVEDSFKDFVNHIKSFLASLEDNKTYKIIPCIKETQLNGEFQVKTISTGLIVSKNTDVLNICEKLKFDINSCIKLKNMELFWKYSMWICIIV